MQLDLAQARQDRLNRLAESTALRAKRLWRQQIGRDFDSSWDRLGPAVTQLTAAGQVAAAAGASTYLASTARADELTVPSGGTVQPAAYGGVDASGRDLEGLLYGAVTAAKIAIGAGSGLQGAFQAGGTFLAVMARTAVLDTGRSADLTAMTARSYTHYVRVVSAGACSRCAILAGTQSAERAFKRHPGCHCTAAPENDPESVKGRFSSPAEYFESLTPAEQDRVFTKSGAEAIRLGADEVTVVSARRGAAGIDYSSAIVSGRTLPNSGRRLVKTQIGRDRDGIPILGYTTGEGTTVRGSYAKRQIVAGTGTKKIGTRYRTVKRIRLMPETILGLTEDVELRQALLRDAGYLRAPAPTRDEMSSALGGTYSRRVADQIRADRATAEAFYREHGIHLG